MLYFSFLYVYFPSSSFVLLFMQAIMNKLWFGMNLKDAISSKVVSVNSDNSVFFEDGFDKVDIFF